MKKYTSQVGLILFALLTLLLTVLAIIKMFEVFKNPSYLFVASFILIILTSNILAKIVRMYIRI